MVCLFILFQNPQQKHYDKKYVLINRRYKLFTGGDRIIPVENMSGPTREVSGCPRTKHVAFLCMAQAGQETGQIKERDPGLYTNQEPCRNVLCCP